MQIGLINRAQYNIRVYKQLQNSNRVASASGTKSLSLIAVEIVRLQSNYFTPFTFVMKILTDILHLIDTFSVRFNIVTFFLLFTIRHVGQQWVTFITRLAVDQSFPVFFNFYSCWSLVVLFPSFGELTSHTVSRRFCYCSLSIFADVVRPTLADCCDTWREAVTRLQEISIVLGTTRLLHCFTVWFAVTFGAVAKDDLQCRPTCL